MEKVNIYCKILIFLFFLQSTINGIHIKYISICSRNQEENTDHPCFPTRNDRMAFINDITIRERCVNIKTNFWHFL